MHKEKPILYIAEGAHRTDPEGTITIGTTTLGGMVCREKNKIMDIKWVETLDSRKTKGQWDYLENNNMGIWVDTLLDRQRVWGDKTHLDAINCAQNRTNNWWNLGTVTIEELAVHVKEKIERG